MAYMVMIEYQLVKLVMSDHNGSGMVNKRKYYIYNVIYLN